MSEPQKKIMACLSRILEITPDMRFGQLVDFVAAFARPEDRQATSNVDDDELLRACEEHLEQLERFAADRQVVGVH